MGSRSCKQWLDLLGPAWHHPHMARDRPKIMSLFVQHPLCRPSIQHPLCSVLCPAHCASFLVQHLSWEQSSCIYGAKIEKPIMPTGRSSGCCCRRCWSCRSCRNWTRKSSRQNSHATRPPGLVLPRSCKCQWYHTQSAERCEFEAGSKQSRMADDVWSFRTMAWSFRTRFDKRLCHDNEFHQWQFVADNHWAWLFRPICPRRINIPPAASTNQTEFGAPGQSLAADVSSQAMV